MANWCFNTVVFEGTPEATKQIQQLFKEMAEQQEKEKCGQLPQFIEDTDDGYFFDISSDDDTIAVFQFETKWNPNTKIILQIAKKFKVDFTLDYEELGNGIMGRATLTDGIFADNSLQYEDFENFRYDSKTDTYHFEGKVYDSEWEILQTLLEYKIENNLNSNKIQNDETIR